MARDKVPRNKIPVLCLMMILALPPCHAQDSLDIEGFSNDSPFNVEPKKKADENFRSKMGTPITLKCSNHHHADQVTWEYKECTFLYDGIMCDLQDLTSKNKTIWKKRSNKHRYEIGALKKSHSGLYRCMEKGVVKKSVIITVVGSEGYEGKPPTVESLLTSNITGQFNTEFTLQCNISSIIPPTVIWFKRCLGLKCDIVHDETCYCHLNVTTSSYNMGNVYISKMNIFNAKTIHSGLYACLAVTEYGKDYKNVTINVPDTDPKRIGSDSFKFLFLVPLALVVALLLVWWCYVKRKRRKLVAVVVAQQQRSLLSAASSSRVRAAV